MTKSDKSVSLVALQGLTNDLNSISKQSQRIKSDFLIFYIIYFLCFDKDKI